MDSRFNMARRSIGLPFGMNKVTERQFQSRRIKLLCAPHGKKRKAQRKLVKLRTKMLRRELGL